MKHKEKQETMDSFVNEFVATMKAGLQEEIEYWEKVGEVIKKDIVHGSGLTEETMESLERLNSIQESNRLQNTEKWHKVCKLLEANDKPWPIRISKRKKHED